MNNIVFTTKYDGADYRIRQIDSNDCIVEYLVLKATAQMSGDGSTAGLVADPRWIPVQDDADCAQIYMMAFLDMKQRFQPDLTDEEFEKIQDWSAVRLLRQGRCPDDRLEALKVRVDKFNKELELDLKEDAGNNRAENEARLKLWDQLSPPVEP